MSGRATRVWRQRMHATARGSFRTALAAGLLHSLRDRYSPYLGANSGRHCQGEEADMSTDIRGASAPAVRGRGVDRVVTAMSAGALLVFVVGAVVKQVDLEAGLIVVDWSPDY